MPKIKLPRKSTAIDMTAMCDVAFLLLTFFMLTSNFTQKEIVQVTIPSSTSEIKIPETNVLEILIDNTGKVFIGMDGQARRMSWLEKVGDAYHITFTDTELKKFSLLNNFGVPINSMKEYLSLKPDELYNKENAIGVPADSADNEFRTWVQAARVVNPEIRIAIKADESTAYPKIKNVMNTLQDLNENRYNLITSLEQDPLKKKI